VLGGRPGTGRAPTSTTTEPLEGLAGAAAAGLAGVELDGSGGGELVGDVAGGAVEEDELTPSVAAS
jgi:hypothetical protein